VRALTEEIRTGGLKWDLEAILEGARQRGEYSHERPAGRGNKKGGSR